MLRWATSVVGAFLFVVAAAPASQGRDVGPALRLGGAPLQLLAGRGSLWVLTCDHGCTGEARHSTGRIMRIDPRNARVVGSAKIPRPNTVAIGAGGLYATDFEHGTIRRSDLHSLQAAARRSTFYRLLLDRDGDSAALFPCSTNLCASPISSTG